MTKTDLTPRPRPEAPEPGDQALLALGRLLIPTTELRDSARQHATGLSNALIGQIASLDNTNFRALVAGLNLIRDGKESSFQILRGPRLAPIANLLTQLYNLAESASPTSSGGKDTLNSAARDAILVARHFCSTGGINIIDPNNHRALLRRDRSIQVTSGQGDGDEIIRIEASHNPPGALLVTVLAGDGHTVQDQKTLHSGKAFVCGRKPTSSQPFGVDLDLSRGVSRDVEPGPLCLQVSWSRGCLFVVNEGGKTGLFDRGSLNKLVVRTYQVGKFRKELSHTEYQPKVTQDDSGNATFGHSVVFRQESAAPWRRLVDFGRKLLGW